MYAPHPNVYTPPPPADEPAFDVSASSSYRGSVGDEYTCYTGAGAVSARFWRVSMAIVLDGHSRLTSNSRHDAAHA
jgi:hypothetical protein